MNDYMRKIFYLRQVEKGSPALGAGYVRLERKEEYMQILLCVTEGCIPEGRAVCGLYEKDGEWHRLELGNLLHMAGTWETRRRLTSLPDRGICDRIAGIWIGDAQNYWVGGDPAVELPCSTIAEQQPVAPSAPPQEEEEEKEKTDVAELKAAEMYPFEDDEMVWCRQIAPEDFSTLPMSCWRLGSNSFVLHGYYNYRHLLYASDGVHFYIGVPGQYHRKEQYLAGRFGFPRFKATKRKRMTIGDFGYWLQEIGGV